MRLLWKGFPELLQSDDGRNKQPELGIFLAGSFFQQFSAIGVFVCDAFLIWSYLPTQFH